MSRLQVKQLMPMGEKLGPSGKTRPPRPRTFKNILISFWVGHSDSEMSSCYGKQLLEDVEFLKEWAKKVRPAPSRK